MAENQDKANMPEDSGNQGNAAKETGKGEPDAMNQREQGKGESDAKDQAKDKRNPEDTVNRPHNNNDQSEEPTTGHTGYVVGDNINFHQSTQNFYILRDAYNGFDSFDTLLQKFSNDGDPVRRAYKDLSSSSNHDTPLTNNDTNTQDSDIKALKTSEEIEDWYCEQLTEWETSFVQAAAVLHGAPFHKIRDAAETLYHPSSISAEGTATSKSVPRISEKRLHIHLRMKILFTDGAERIFWYDANTSGLSTFAVRLLPIIVRQATLAATNQQGLHFLKQIEEWSTTLSGECAWRANRALGGIWIKSDKNHFLHIVNEWVTSNNSGDWRRAATLLDGAYEVEYAEQGEQVNKGNNSFVLSLLARWTQHAHASFQGNFGSTVAQAYGRIGQRSLAPALKGLDTLLHYPLRRKNDRNIQVPLIVFVSATWSYVSLARFGYVRDVLQHVSSIAEKYCYQRHSPQGEGRRQYRAECSFMLETMFHIFILIASASLNGAQHSTHSNYTQEMRLPQNPLLSNEEGQDVLLAGVLSSGETEWRQHILNILCAAILEKNAEPAFYLLKIWAEIVLKVTGPQRPVLRETFLCFLLELAERGDLWCSRLVKMGEYDYPDLFAIHFKEALQQWQVKKSGVPPQPLGAFAKDVSRRLNI